MRSITLTKKALARLATGTIVSTLFLSPLTFAPASFAVEDETASAADSEVVEPGDLISDSSTDLADIPEPGPRAFSGAEPQEVSVGSVALTTRALNAAYLDPTTGKMFSVTRTADPAAYFANTVKNTGTSLEISSNYRDSLSPGRASSEIARNGNYVAFVSTQATGAKSAPVMTYSYDTGKPAGRAVQVPGYQAFSIVPNKLSPSAAPSEFWIGSIKRVGTTDYPWLSLVDVAKGTVIYQTELSGRQNIRSMSNTPAGLLLGAGYPAELLLLTNNGGGYKLQSLDVLNGNIAGNGGSSSVPYAMDTWIQPAETSADPSYANDTAADNAGEAAAETTDEDGVPNGVDPQQSEPESADVSASAEGTDSDPAEDPAQEATVSEDDAAAQPRAAVTPAASVAYTLVGYENAAKIALLRTNSANNSVELVDVANFPDGRTVDRISIGEDGVAWFTLRPEGNLYKVDLKDAAATGKLNIGKPVAMPSYWAETRNLSATDNGVYGLDSYGSLWFYNDTTGKVISADVLKTPLADRGTQSIVKGASGSVVTGHWHSEYHLQNGAIKSIVTPGEAKAGVTVGNNTYLGIYPSGTLWKVDGSGTLSKTPVASTGESFMRPSAVVYNAARNQIGVAVGPKYGSYGGALMTYSLADGSSKTYKPTGTQKITAMDSYKNSYVYATSPQGEQAATVGGTSTIAMWAPDGNGNVIWNRLGGYIGWNENNVIGLRIVQNAGAPFVLAIGAGGTVTALDASTGKLLWTRNVGRSFSQLLQAEGRLIGISGSSAYDVSATRAGVSITAIAPAVGSIQQAYAEGTGSGAQLKYVQSDSLILSQANLTGSRGLARTMGNDRYETAVAVSKESYQSANTVVLASGSVYADALVSAPLANKLDAPLLLTTAGSLPESTKNEILRLGANRVLVVGGDSSVSNKVVSSLPGSVSVERLAGSNRYGTSLKVAERLEGLSSQKLNVVAAPGTNFPDALTSAPVAQVSNAAIILVRDAANLGGTESWLRARNVSAAIGGEAVRATSARGIHVQDPISGNDRYSTASAVAQRYFRGTDTVFVASGETFPDALSGGVLAASSGSALVLVKKDSVPSGARSALARQANVGASRAWLLGGQNTISTDIGNTLRTR